jgi:Ca2+/Na+ antiporter
MDNSRVSVRKIRYDNFFAPLGIFILIFVLQFAAIVYFDFDLTSQIILAVTMILLYTFCLLMISRPSEYKEVRKTNVVTVESPVRKFEDSRFSSPRRDYDYVGSNARRVYHKKTCRLAKLIKPKYKEQSNDLAFFKDRKYKACKICMSKK